MRQSSEKDLIRQLPTIAGAAGDIIIYVYASGISEIQRKEECDPVTEANLAAHCVLITTEAFVDRLPTGVRCDGLYHYCVSTRDLALIPA
jgi:hypothetical protein